jgi:hypothetical protein
MKKLPADTCAKDRASLDGRLASYLSAASAIGAVTAAESQAVVVGNSTVQPFGINGAVNIDFNNDGQTDFQIDHDRVNLSGSTLDYLQIDKNDVNGELNPLIFDPGPDTTFQATPFMDGATPRNDANNSAYAINPNMQGSYPAALTAGTSIGPTASFDFQESGNFQGGGKNIRANRLIDEDATQVDQMLGGQPASGVQVPFNGPNFIGLGGDVRYLGLKMELNNAGVTNYGWVGVRIDNEADATGAVVGYGYETLPNIPIAAGAVPEPGAMVIAAMGGVALLGSAARRRFRGKKLGSQTRAKLA